MAKAAKKPSAKQIAARKKFAAMAKARAKKTTKKVAKKPAKKPAKKAVKRVKKVLCVYAVEHSKNGKTWKLWDSKKSQAAAMSLAKRLAKANPDYYIRVSKK